MGKSKDIPPFFNSDHPGDNVNRVKCVARFLDEMFAFQSDNKLSDDARSGLATTLEWIGDACEVIESQIDRELATSKQQRDKSIELMRDLFTRLYTITYYLEPDKTNLRGMPTKKHALAAMDGLFSVVHEIQDQLDIGNVAVCDAKHGGDNGNA